MVQKTYKKYTKAFKLEALKRGQFHIIIIPL
jgi:hypothetical protein